MMFEIRKNSSANLNGPFCKIMKYPYISYIWCGTTGPIGPLPKNGHRYFIFSLSYSMDKKSHHKKFYHNLLKNKKVITCVCRRHIAVDLSERQKSLKLSQILSLLLCMVVFILKCIILSWCCSYDDCLRQLWLKQTLV